MQRLQTEQIRSVVFALSGSFGLLFALDAGLLVMLSLTNLLLDARLGAASLKAAQCAVQCLILFDNYA